MKFGPFYGPLFKSFMLKDQDTISLQSVGAFRAAEAEFAFRLKAGLPARSDRTIHTEKEIWECIDTVSCAIEIASGRFTGTYTPALVLGDYALNGCFVLGEPFYVKGMKIDDFASIKATLESNGKNIASDFGSNVLGNPISALTWLANRLNRDGLALKPGQIVITGAVCASKEVSVPGRLTANLEGFPNKLDIGGDNSLHSDPLPPPMVKSVTLKLIQ
jgi:2-keto-4-pentenoate hydratase